MAVIGYIRVSTDKQTYAHQRFEIEQYAKNYGLNIDDWVEEKIWVFYPVKCMWPICVIMLTEV